MLSAQSRHSYAFAHLLYSYYFGWKDLSQGQGGSEIEQDRQSVRQGSQDPSEPRGCAPQSRTQPVTALLDRWPMLLDILIFKRKPESVHKSFLNFTYQQLVHMCKY